MKGLQIIAFAAALAIVQCRGIENRALERALNIPHGLSQRHEIAPSHLAQYEEERMQNENAHYAFDTKIEDNISDLTHERQEIRDGLNVKGHYTYSDGYVRKTVHYEADENGYRVLGEEETPLDGPHVNLKGTASVSQAAHGQLLEYQVQSVPVEEGTKIV